MTQTELANRLNTTRQNLNNKMSRGNFSIQELSDISQILDTELILRDQSGKEYKITYDN